MSTEPKHLSQATQTNQANHTNQDKSESFNPISWMIHHGIAPHLLMFALLVGGLVMSLVIRKEYMPDASLDRVSVLIRYDGAAPSEIEASIAAPVEDTVSNVQGIKRVEARIGTGYMWLAAELEANANAQKVLQDVQQEVGRIASFPEGIEKPRVRLDNRVLDVMEIVLHGEMEKASIKRLAEQIRGRMLQSPYISQVDIQGLPAEQIHVEIPQRTLQNYDLSLNQVSSIIKRSVLERSAGKIKSAEGDILVSIDERAYWANELAKTPLINNEEGVQLLLGDIAEVTEGFADERRLVTYDGQLSARIKVYRVGDQSPSDIADALEEMWPSLEGMLPPNAGLAVVDDDAKSYQKRLSLLLNNAFIGLLLVFVVMSLFLRFKLAFWVVVGIPSSFLGAILFLPIYDVSINMVSMFGFIIALGIVVDDAIIAGENVYAHMQEGMSYFDAAIQGAKEVAKPLTFAILTNIVAFLPLLLLPGQMKLLFGAIPIVVVLCFVISWVEALFIMPSHLARIDDSHPNVVSRFFNKLQSRSSAFLQAFIYNVYSPFLAKCLKWPSLVIAISLSILVLVLGHAFSGKMGFSLYPKTDSRWVKASYQISESDPLEKAIYLRETLENSAQAMLKEHDVEDMVISVRSVISDESVEVGLLLVPSEEREYSSRQLKEWWSEQSKELRKQGKLSFSGARRNSSDAIDAALTVQIRHPDTEILKAASKDITDFLESIETVSATVNSMEAGKPQWKLTLNENGRALGLDPSELASQMRAALYGAKAQRQQRLSNDVITLVRLPREERERANDIESLMIRTKGGGYAPLGSVADINKVYAPSRIIRRDGQRIEKIGAEIQDEEAIPAVQQAVQEQLVPELAARYPTLKLVFAGDQEKIAESVSSLELGTGFALTAIYILLAIAFRSYGQPLLVMAVIPFGAVGAILGHLLLGYSLSVVSLMGMLALAGIVVNDSLILVEYANQQREKGVAAFEAIMLACQRRFRPIILTTLTTFGGLAPMVFETSRQAQFVVPMAVSLGFGIIFTTFICLLMLPSLYMAFSQDSEEFRQTQRSSYNAY
ncbi:efflux RND transporter permease subunit [Paraglaciecola sp.]|uniref:efflux RND transporter permease subunit n=1 Tax=Paraglaciecola sp. TaxID=1920173 RepID=UPI003EF2802C